MPRGGGFRGGGGGGRGGGSSSFYSGSRSSSSTSKSAAQTPTPAHARAPRATAPTPAPASAPAPAKNDSGTGFLAAVADGFGWGFGRSMGHRVADFFAGRSRVDNNELNVASDAPGTLAQSMDTNGGSDVCYASMKTFSDCLNSNVSDISKCQFYMDILSQCRGNSGSVPNAAF